MTHGLGLQKDPGIVRDSPCIPEVGYVRVHHREIDFDRAMSTRMFQCDRFGLFERNRHQLVLRGAELLFQVLTKREETNSVAIASNESFSGWTKTFTDPRLCAAIVDRLTFGSYIFETGTTSYRLPPARAQRASQTTNR